MPEQGPAPFSPPFSLDEPQTPSDDGMRSIDWALDTPEDSPRDSLASYGWEHEKEERRSRSSSDTSSDSANVGRHGSSGVAAGGRSDMIVAPRVRQEDAERQRRVRQGVERARNAMLARTNCLDCRHIRSDADGRCVCERLQMQGVLAEHVVLAYAAAARQESTKIALAAAACTLRLRADELPMCVKRQVAKLGKMALNVGKREMPPPRKIPKRPRLSAVDSRRTLAEVPEMLSIIVAMNLEQTRAMPIILAAARKEREKTHAHTTTR